MRSEHHIGNFYTKHFLENGKLGHEGKEKQSLASIGGMVPKEWTRWRRGTTREATSLHKSIHNLKLALMGSVVTYHER